jgi:hypothetical protein
MTCRIQVWFVFSHDYLHPTTINDTMIVGSHMKHNEKTGDNVGPLIVTVKKEE